MTCGAPSMRSTANCRGGPPWRTSRPRSRRVQPHASVCWSGLSRWYRMTGILSRGSSRQCALSTAVGRRLGRRVRLWLQLRHWQRLGRFQWAPAVERVRCRWRPNSILPISILCILVLLLCSCGSRSPVHPAPCLCMMRSINAPKAIQLCLVRKLRGHMRALRNGSSRGMIGGRRRRRCSNRGTLRLWQARPLHDQSRFPLPQRRTPWRSVWQPWRRRCTR